MKALCVGHCSYDIICPVEAYPIEDNKYKIEGRIDSGGGSAANAAFLLGKWGIETYMAGVVGSDDFGQKIRKELESVQVKTDNIETIFDQPTAISFVLVNKSNGSRTIFSPSMKSSGQARKYNYTMDPDVILIDGYEYTASREAINNFPNAISIIDAETSTPEVLELCKYSKYIVCSKNFAETISKTKIDYNNPKTLIAAYQGVKNRFPNNEIVITLSEKGAMYSVGDEIKIMPGLNRQVKDTTGAGDIFHGAFAYGLLNNFPIEKCVSYGNIAAGLSVSEIGARASMPSLNEVISIFNEKNNPGKQSSPAPEQTPQAAPEQTPAEPAPAPEVTPEQTPAEPAPAPEVTPAQTPAESTTVAENSTPEIPQMAAESNNESAPNQAAETPQENVSSEPNMAIPDQLPEAK